ncbi:MAG: patatin family protein [Paludibacter sp.]|nr:patatin family protein [Bacteroidales bacterium]MCM1069475.1 patatin family protein [Prevotella sp.]MCM1354131.1 patatin family protein [Bacteroides sp.]MCM1443012.1 patatin family protein [Muribaculum sp.]MCM1482206.1 patatin family protein [Paludibacter sp.]
MKIGLVLEGGGMRGMYTAGVLDKMLDNDFTPDVICGTSAGAIFGVNMVSGQRGRTIRYNKKYVGDKRYISLRSFFTTGNMINRKFGCEDIPHRLDPFDEVAFEQSPIRFYATITNMRTGKAEYVHVKNCFEQMDVLWASSALPIITRPVHWKGEKYLDGGLADNIPMEGCVQQGCDKLVVVLTRPFGYRKHELIFLICSLIYCRYPRLLKTILHRNPYYNKQIDKILQLEAEGKIFVIRPSIKMNIGRLEKNPDKLQQLYNLGIADTESQWEALQAYLKA